MTQAAAAQRLAQLIAAASGNLIPSAHLPFLAEIARERAQICRLPGVEAYVEALARGALPGEWRALLPRVTVKESYLFRTPQQFQVIAREIVPALVRARGQQRKLCAWSAGCARGEEPATLAIVLAEHPLLAGWSWCIVATDIDDDALAQARRGFLSNRAVQEVPEPLRHRYLTSCRGGWQLAPALLQRIDYQWLNLVQEPLSLARAPFDVILLRNVLIYFELASQRRVAAAVAQLLAPDGALFLGPAETLWQVTDALVPVDAGGCFYYRHATAAPSTPPCPTTIAPRRRSLASLTEPPRPTPEPVPPDRAWANPDRLRRAVAAIAAKQLDLAVAQVEEALLADPSDPVAHVLEGFLHDVGGRWQAAAASYRAALFLRPELAQVRLLLAGTLRRLGLDARARRELRQALSLLDRRGGWELAELTALGVPAGEALCRHLEFVLARTQARR